MAPPEVCFCALIPVVIRDAPDVLVVRHAREAPKVSGTGQLTARVLGAKCVDTGSREGPLELAPHLRPGAVMLFPGGRTEIPSPPPSQLVILDGTWGQARQMRARLPGLAGLPVWSVADLPHRPRMREAPDQGGMSTMEAVAQALHLLGDEASAAALFKLYAHMTAVWLNLRHHPDREEAARLSDRLRTSL